MQKNAAGTDLGIYIHIPFCTRKCPYCAFPSIPAAGIFEGYTDAVLKEIAFTVHLFSLDGMSIPTVYFGGGTPSLLDTGDVRLIMDELAELFDVDEDCEVTLEINPASAGKEKIEKFKRAGVNRLSIGAQSFDEKNLRFLNRLHDAEESKRCFFHAREAGFENIGIDIIFAIPGQRKESLLTDLEQAAALGPEHISLYLFTIEEETAVYSRAMRGEFEPVEDAMQEEMFLAASEYLKTAGYRRYETSNYARPGFESKHNMRYWKGMSYLGLGAGAHSHLAECGWGMRWWNTDDPTRYVRTVGKGYIPVAGLELLDRNDAIAENILLSLRTGDGLKQDAFNDRFGIPLSNLIPGDVNRHIPEEFLSTDEKGVSLTDRGALRTDEIAATILSLH